MNHLVRKTTNPVSAPTESGIHWINTVTNEEFFSVGTSSVSDWLPRLSGQLVIGGTTGQSLVKASNADFDVEWSNVATTDEKVKVSSNDTTSKYLEDAITVSHGTNASTVLEKSTLNDGGDEDVQIQFDVSKVDLSLANNTTSDFASEAYVDNAVSDVFKRSGLYMFTSTNSDIPGYKVATFIDDYTTGPLGSVTAPVTTFPTLMEEFATGPLNQDRLSPGALILQYNTQKASGSSNYYSYFELYKRTSGGVETLLGISSGSSVSALNTVVRQNPSMVLDDIVPLLLTDRIIVKIYCVFTSGSSNISLTYDGTTASRAWVPSSALPYAPENVANKSTDPTFAENSDSLYPSQSAVKPTYDLINNHLVDVTDAHDASAISNIPSGNLAATDVQTALNELQSDVDTKLTGPGSSTDNSVVRFDGVTGSLIQDSAVTISDLADITGVNKITVLSGTSREYEIAERVFNASGTGLSSFIGGLSINGGDVTKFDVGPVVGSVVDHTVSTYNSVNYAGSTLNIPLVANGQTFVLLNSLSALILQTTTPTAQERRDNIYLGTIFTSAGNVIYAQTEPVTVVSPVNDLYDLAKSIKIFNESGNQYSPNGANLNMNKSAGVIFSISANYKINTKNPNRVSSAAATPVSFSYFTQNAGSAGVLVTAIDPNNYDVGGVITPVPGGGNTCTVQRIYTLVNGVTYVQYGQATYPNMADALQNFATEVFVQNPASAAGVLVGILILRKTIVVLNNSATARFLLPSKFGEITVGSAGLSVTSLQQAYNNSTTPEIVTDSILTALTVRRGSAADTDNVLEGKNGASTTTFAVTGNGAITAGTYNGIVPGSIMDVQTFSASGTWTKPSWATGTQVVEVFLLGGGGGGGSGRKRAVGTNGCGGGGGGGGGLVTAKLQAASLGATQAVTVGAGGAGGAAISTNSTNGSVGGAGGVSLFGGFLRATGGAGGNGGSATTGTAGTAILTASSPWNFIQLSGGNAGAAGASGTAGASTTYYGATGGGGGGGVTTVEALGGGAVGGAINIGLVVTATVGGLAGGIGLPGGNGNSTPGIIFGKSVGTGGGSARGSTAAVTGAGGNGVDGGGGGGGGAGTDSVGNSGAGGNGGAGWVVVVTYS